MAYQTYQELMQSPEYQAMSPTEKAAALRAFVFNQNPALAQQAAQPSVYTQNIGEGQTTTVSQNPINAAGVSNAQLMAQKLRAGEDLGGAIAGQGPSGRFGVNTVMGPNGPMPSIQGLPTVINNIPGGLDTGDFLGSIVAPAAAALINPAGAIAGGIGAMSTGHDLGAGMELGSAVQGGYNALNSPPAPVDAGAVDPTMSQFNTYPDNPPAVTDGGYAPPPPPVNNPFQPYQVASAGATPPPPTDGGLPQIQVNGGSVGGTNPYQDITGIPAGSTTAPNPPSPFNIDGLGNAPVQDPLTLPGTNPSISVNGGSIGGSNPFQDITGVPTGSTVTGGAGPTPFDMSGSSLGNVDTSGLTNNLGLPDINQSGGSLLDHLSGTVAQTGGAAAGSAGVATAVNGGGGPANPSTNGDSGIGGGNGGGNTTDYQAVDPYYDPNTGQTAGNPSDVGLSNDPYSGMNLPDWLTAGVKSLAPGVANALVNGYLGSRANSQGNNLITRGNPLNDPQRLPFQQAATQMVNNPGSYFQSNPFAQAYGAYQHNVLQRGIAYAGNAGNVTDQVGSQTASALGANYNALLQNLMAGGGYTMPQQGINAGATLMSQGNGNIAEATRGLGPIVSDAATKIFGTPSNPQTPTPNSTTGSYNMPNTQFG